MPGFSLDPATLALGGLAAIPPIISGFDQRAQARRLKLQNTETLEEREQLGMSRQAANTARMPGQGAQMNRLGMGQNNAMQSARLGAGSGSDFLASAGAADARRMAGEQALGVQGLQYQDQGKRQLRADLTTASNRRQRDLDTFNANKAALLQSGATNLNNGAQTIAAFGAQAYNNNLGAIARAGAPSGVPVQGYNQPGISYDGGDPYSGLPGMGGFGRRSSRYNMGANYGL